MGEAACCASMTSQNKETVLVRVTIILRYNTGRFMGMPMQVNGTRDPFPIPFRKFFNLWCHQYSDDNILKSTPVILVR